MKANAGYFNQETQKVTMSIPQHKGPGKTARALIDFITPHKRR